MFEQKEVTIGDATYYLKKFKTMKGLELQQKMMEATDPEGGFNPAKLSPEVIREVVVNGCSKGSITLDNKKFDDAFAGKLNEVIMLAMEIIVFNFIDPNDLADDSSEQ